VVTDALSSAAFLPSDTVALLHSAMASRNELKSNVLGLSLAFSTVGVDLALDWQLPGPSNATLPLNGLNGSVVSLTTTLPPSGVHTFRMTIRPCVNVPVLSEQMFVTPPTA